MLTFLLFALCPLWHSPFTAASKPGRVVKAVWDDESSINETHVEQLRQQAWDMFDHGYTNYMKHAFPKDNLLPISCGGKDWQGGLAITLVDSLDALVLLNRQQDLVEAVDLVRDHLTFDKDIKVHVFETVIRVLGGLLSGHMLLERNPQLAAATAQAAGSGLGAAVQAAEAEASLPYDSPPPLDVQAPPPQRQYQYHHDHRCDEHQQQHEEYLDLQDQQHHEEHPHQQDQQRQEQQQPPWAAVEEVSQPQRVFAGAGGGGGGAAGWDLSHVPGSDLGGGVHGPSASAAPSDPAGMDPVLDPAALEPAARAEQDPDPDRDPVGHATPALQPSTWEAESGVQAEWGPPEATAAAATAGGGGDESEEPQGETGGVQMAAAAAAAATAVEHAAAVTSEAVAAAAEPPLQSPPLYDGIFLRKAVELADRLLPAFQTPSGLPSLFVHLKTGPVRDAYNSTCTACAGTLLLEFGMLTALTGNQVYLEHANFAARLMYDRRSKLGLVGASLNVVNSEWASRESTIGPGSDSYYEYLLKAYLLFGKAEYLDMFAELYASTMRWMQIPGTFKGYSFLVDVHMDNGRLARPFVSSLGAFWPGMQALAGQERDAIELHANFTAAWRTFGWMPEVFGIDLSKVHPEDPGYNLRPEHIESTYLLHCLTLDPHYLRVARNIQSTLHSHNRVTCGYTNVNHVDTGEHGDLMESYFLSETVKYLYLMFSSAPGLIDYYVLTTEGHLIPPLAEARALDTGNPRQRGEQQGEGGDSAVEAPPDAATDASAVQAHLAAVTAPVQAAGVADAAAVEAAAASAAALNANVGGAATPGALRPGDVGAADADAATTDIAGDMTSAAMLAAAATAAAATAAPPGGLAASGSDDGAPPGELRLPDPIPKNCRKVCTAPPPEEQAATEARLRAAFPLLAFRRSDAELVRHRRCLSCVVVTRRMAQEPLEDEAVRAKIMRLPQNSIDEVPAAEPNPYVLAQVVCTIKVSRDGTMSCNNLRGITQHDAQHGVPYNAIILQIAAVPEDPVTVAVTAPSQPPPPSPPPPSQPPAAGGDGEPVQDSSHRESQPAPPPPQFREEAEQEPLDEFSLVVVRGGAGGEVSYIFEGMPALFGPPLDDATPRCLQHILTAPAAALAAGCDGHLLSPPEGLYGTPRQLTCPAHLQAALLQRAAGIKVGEVNCGGYAAVRDAGQPPWAGAAGSGNVTGPVENGGGSSGNGSTCVGGGDGWQVAGGSVAGAHASGGVAASVVVYAGASGEVMPPPDPLLQPNPLLQPGPGNFRGLCGGGPDVQQCSTEGPNSSTLEREQQPYDAMSLSYGSDVDAREAAGETECGGDRDPEGGAAAALWERGGGGDRGGGAAGGVEGAAEGESGSLADPGSPQLDFGRRNHGDVAVMVGGEGAVGTPDEGQVQGRGYEEGGAVGAKGAGCGVVDRVGDEKSLGVGTRSEGRGEDGKVTPEAEAEARRGGAGGGDGGGHVGEDAAAAGSTAGGVIADGAVVQWEETSHLEGPCGEVPMLTAPLAAMEPLHGCWPPTNAEALAGAVAVVARGDCSFVAKALHAQAAGAVAVVVLNLHGRGGLLRMASDESNRQTDIPAVMLGPADGRRLLRAVAAAAAAGGPPLMASLSHLPIHMISAAGPAARTLEMSTASAAAALGGTRAAAAASSSGGSRSINTRLDLLVPGTSQPFLAANVLSKGRTLQQLFEAVLEDGRAMLLLQQLAQRNVKHVMERLAANQQQLAHQQQQQEQQQQQAQQQQQQLAQQQQQQLLQQVMQQVVQQMGSQQAAGGPGTGSP